MLKSVLADKPRGEEGVVGNNRADLHNKILDLRRKVRGQHSVNLCGSILLQNEVLCLQRTAAPAGFRNDVEPVHLGQRVPPRCRSGSSRLNAPLNRTDAGFFGEEIWEMKFWST